MKKTILSLALTVVLGSSFWAVDPMSAWSATESDPRFPAPATVSPEMAETVAAPTFPLWISKAKTSEEVSKIAKDYAAAAGPAAKERAASYGVKVEEGRLGGVRVYTLTPKNLSADKADKVGLLHPRRRLHFGPRRFGHR